jgi:FkbM family methyltransferase
MGINNPQSVEVTLKDNSKIKISFFPGDIVIDCGASVGDVTALFADKGAAVFSYEPNPHAYSILSKRFENTKNVKCINSAVHTTDGISKLYFHENSSEDPLKYSTGSSLKSEKTNVDCDDFAEVPTVDLAKFIKKIKKATGKNVCVLKVDIEGAECELIQHLIDEDVLRDISYVFVETHEMKNQFLLEATKNMKKRVVKEGLANINFDWI